MPIRRVKTRRYNIGRAYGSFEGVGGSAQTVKHADYKQITVTRPKSTNSVTIDYQLLMFDK